ncbi:Multicopper oxidase with three cupredoxin domains [Geosmithia morbida]|uniref:Multicopper oxidase with three cupredoxin domains n=1 Tax=Geosmithia morbida TaxID=1094350 RepID=A0A9P4YQD5_9HYPO|nr:Multicopper oxidase with three cupredoxin domains [Geosmithia morbida]KAF4119887.1 Multicopper oxidase with three cupredoxin domains [Geosmithia morbida]
MSAGEDSHAKLEEQPFLEDGWEQDGTSLGGSAQPDHWSIKSKKGQASWIAASTIVILVTITLFGLSVIALNMGTSAGTAIGSQDTQQATASSSSSSSSAPATVADEPAQDQDGEGQQEGDHKHPTAPVFIEEPQQEEEEEEDSGTPSDKNRLVQYHEDLPSIPRLRDTSAYILDRSWAIDAPPTTREFFWTISDAQLNPDGVYRPMMLVNNQFPGPLVECNEGDRIVVHVENRAANATAIHFHGLFQNGTNAMDGTVGITQCAIAPNSNFTYTFDVRGQSGTYWYHAHHSAQASDGLLGPMVIHSTDEPTLQEMHYDTDRVVMVQDHYHNTTAELLMDYLQPGRENDEPVPENGLINGRGVRSCEEFAGWPCDDTDVTAPVIDLVRGQRHRIRFINVGAFAEFQIQFDEHPFYVTEVDGTDVHPEPFHRLNILPAQRYSVILEANLTTTDSFWMRARMVTHCFTRDNPLLEAETRAIVRYIYPDAALTTTDVAVAQPETENWPDAIEITCRDLNTTLLKPVRAQTPPPSDHHVNLRANFMIGHWTLARGFFNDSTWHANSTHPSLHRLLESGRFKSPSVFDAPGLYANNVDFDPEHDFVLQTTGVRTVDISINNFDDGAHPFHLHGHKFYVLIQSTSGYPPTPEELPRVLDERGLLDNPLRRDTVTVQGYAWAVIRVVLDNPGLWAFHCHNAWHAESGMVMQFLSRGDVVKDWELAPEQKDICRRLGVERGMRPPDSLWFGII